MRLAFTIVALTFLAAAPVGGQSPAPGPTTAARPATVTAPSNPVPPLEPQGYDYEPSGRRDPFISLVRRTASVQGLSASSRPTGKAGLAADDFVLRGLIKSRRGWIAQVKGTDNRSYDLEVGDELYDSKVKAVTADGVVLLQNVNDPLSTARTREVKKMLRPTQEAQ